MAKSNYGEGSVFPRKDGRWVAQLKMENGKKRQVYRKSEKEANTALRKMLREKEQGVLVPGSRQTVFAYLDDWLEKEHRHQVRVGTYANYRINLDTHIAPALGHIQLQKLTWEQIQSFYDSLLEEGLSPGTIKIIHGLLHRALDTAVKRGLVGRNVCDLASRPSLTRHEVTPFNEEQARRLLEAVSGQILEGVITLALTTGMREGELLALRWSEINLDAGSLQIRRTIQRISGHGLVESEAKTSMSRRNIILPAFVVESLKRHHVRQLEQRVKMGEKWKKEDFVFSNCYGGYKDANQLRLEFKRLLQAADLPLIRFHDLRHSAATILLGMGVHPKIVQELLGHSNINTTMDIYSHVLPSMQKEAMGKLDTLFGKQSSS